MKAIDLTIPKGAIFSDDGKFRYALWRVWRSNPIVRVQISLNPSKAGAWNDDPTIARSVINFAFRVIRTLYNRNGLEWPFNRGESPEIREDRIVAPALDPGIIGEMIVT